MGAGTAALSRSSASAEIVAQWYAGATFWAVCGMRGGREWYRTPDGTWSEYVGDAFPHSCERSAKEHAEFVAQSKEAGLGDVWAKPI